MGCLVAVVESVVAPVVVAGVELSGRRWGGRGVVVSGVESVGAGGIVVVGLRVGCRRGDRSWGGRWSRSWGGSSSRSIGGE